MNSVYLLLVTILASGAINTGAGKSASLEALGGFMALSVPDAEASARWYADKLGMKVVLRPAATPDFRVIVLEGRGWTVELVQRRDARPLGAITPQGTSRDQIHGLFKAGVLVEDLGKTLAFLEAREVPIAFGPYPAQGNQRANCIIRDLDGNLIQFIESARTPQGHDTHEHE